MASSAEPLSLGTLPQGEATGGSRAEEVPYWSGQTSPTVDLTAEPLGSDGWSSRSWGH